MKKNTYKSKITGETYSGTTFKHLKDGAGDIFALIKVQSKILKENKEGKVIKGKKYYDWEAIKLIMKMPAGVEVIVMNLECIGFCKFEFGSIDKDLLFAISKYIQKTISEKQLDKLFEEFLIDLNKKNTLPKESQNTKIEQKVFKTSKEKIINKENINFFKKIKPLHYAIVIIIGIASLMIIYLLDNKIPAKETTYNNFNPRLDSEFYSEWDVYRSYTVPPNLSKSVFLKNDMSPVNGILTCKYGEVGLFVNGRREGIHKTWFKSSNNVDGQLRSISNFQNGKQIGSYKEYYRSSTIALTCTFVNGKIHGESIRYFMGYGNNVAIKCNYWMGILDGKYEEFSSSGEVLKQCFYKNGRRHGEYKEWNKKRQLKLKCNYYNGGLDGQYFKYYYNGRLEESGKYKYGFQVGEWKYWHRNGQLKGEGRFSGGNGTDMGSTGIPRNKREGKWSFWYEDGEFQGLHNYEYGEISYFPTQEIFNNGVDIFLETR